MKRYSSTPNRLSYLSGKFIPPTKQYTNNYFSVLFILAIVFIIILLLYKSCFNDTNHQQIKMENGVKINQPKQESKNTIMKKVPRKISEISDDNPPRDSLPPETNLKILTDEH